MADKKIEVDESLLIKMQEQMAEMERKLADTNAKNAGLEELFGKTDTEGKEKLRQKKSFEPKFRTVRVRQFPIGGGTDLGYIVGWTSKGAYEEVDRTGVSPQTVNFIDVIFLGQEKTKEGKIKAEKVKLLDLLNKSVQVHCKIVDTKREEVPVGTGEEINISVFDPQHGLIETGDVIDGYVTHSEIKYKVEIPGQKEAVWIDAIYLN